MQLLRCGGAIWRHKKLGLTVGCLPRVSPIVSALCSTRGNCEGVSGGFPSHHGCMFSSSSEATAAGMEVLKRTDANRPASRIVLEWDNKLKLPASWRWRPPLSGESDRWFVTCQCHHHAWAFEPDDIGIDGQGATIEEAVEQACGLFLCFISEEDQPLTADAESCISGKSTALPHPVGLIQLNKLQTGLLPAVLHATTETIDPAGRFAVIEYESQQWTGSPSYRYGVYDRVTGHLTAAANNSASPGGRPRVPASRATKPQVVAAACARMLRDLGVHAY